jgi:hypothetical protein
MAYRYEYVRAIDVLPVICEARSVGPKSHAARFALARHRGLWPGMVSDYALRMLPGSVV